MTTTPTPETLMEWRTLCPGRHLNELQHSLCGALAEAATACEALIAERDSLNEDLHRIRATADAISEDVCVDIERIKEERDQALARVKELEEEVRRVRKERLTARAEDFHRTGCLHRWRSAPGAINIVCEKCGAEGAP